MSVLPYLAGESWARENNMHNEEVSVEENQKTCTVMLGLGIAQCICSFIVGRLVAKVAKTTVIHFNFITAVVAILYTAFTSTVYYVLLCKHISYRTIMEFIGLFQLFFGEYRMLPLTL